MSRALPWLVALPLALALGACGAPACKVSDELPQGTFELERSTLQALGVDSGTLVVEGNTFVLMVDGPQGSASAVYEVVE